MGMGVWELQLQLARVDETESVCFKGMNRELGGVGGWTTHNLCMRETMVLNAAWMSAVVQVQTTGRWWFCSMSERNWERGRKSSQEMKSIILLFGKEQFGCCTSSAGAPHLALPV